ncbi:MAG TPA: ribonuclease HI [Candidatus Acidoferrum sp.]|nr:ribonuclease HI [Candidatus Acidoferrum sp.]
MKQVEIYTDGACSGNPGPGGYGAILRYGGRERELSGGRRLTTNNRMELLAAITALSALKEPCKVTLYSDSSYLVSGMEKGWAEGWQRRGWKKADGAPALNPDLWGKLLELCKAHSVNYVWVRGHAENAFNNRCDALAVAGAATASEPDEVYEHMMEMSGGR